ncbi:MAG: hypothetical protein H0W85_07750 [Methylotenera sp.]|nr:hypothetical protein [Methylotenera sp.]
MNTVVEGEVLTVPDTKNGGPAYISIHRAIKEAVKVLPLRYKHHYYYDRFVEARIAAKMEIYISMILGTVRHQH